MLRRRSPKGAKRVASPMAFLAASGRGICGTTIAPKRKLAAVARINGVSSNPVD
jgi:hypothetical protein